MLGPKIVNTDGIARELYKLCVNWVCEGAVLVDSLLLRAFITLNVGNGSGALCCL